MISSSIPSKVLPVIGNRILVGKCGDVPSSLLSIPVQRGWLEPVTWSRCGKFHSLVAPAPGDRRLFGRGPWGAGLMAADTGRRGRSRSPRNTVLLRLLVPRQTSRGGPRAR